MVVGYSGVLTQDISSVRLPTQGMMHPGSQSGSTLIEFLLLHIIN
jgi:hypothetical protein